MISSLITSSRGLIQLVVFYLLLLSVGAQLGLKADGPFEYLRIQFKLVDVRATLLESLPPGTNAPWIEPIMHTAMDVAMRGVTLGYTLPDWVVSEHVFAVAGFLSLAALIVLTRAWRYTTWTLNR